ncbi:MAG: hypothetical protein LHV68_07350 [Elusimicrobia bacterium]|nr:hypothetical protein [Candidatus Liberimonas magnetica]
MSRYEIIVYEDCREITYRGKKIKLGEQQHIVVCKTITKLFHDTFQLHSTERPGLCRTWEGKDLTKRKPEEIKNSMDNVIRDILPDSIITYSNVNSIVRDIRDKTSPDIIVNIKKQGIYFNYSPLFINYIKGHAFSHILD